MGISAPSPRVRDSGARTGSPVVAGHLQPGPLPGTLQGLRLSRSSRGSSAGLANPDGLVDSVCHSDQRRSCAAVGQVTARPPGGATRWTTGRAPDLPVLRAYGPASGSLTPIFTQRIDSPVRDQTSWWRGVLDCPPGTMMTFHHIRFRDHCHAVVEQLHHEHPGYGLLRRTADVRGQGGITCNEDELSA